MWMSLGLLAGVSAAAIGLAIMGSNRLQALNSRCDKAAADIDVQLQHRHQLIPNLLELLKGFVAHETKQLEMIAQLQVAAVTAASSQQRLQAEEILGNKIKQVVLSANQIPQLHANAHFVRLREELSDADNKISAARRFLNLAVDEYNAALKSFPNSALSRLHGLQARSFFSLGVDRPVIEEGPVIKF